MLRQLLNLRAREYIASLASLIACSYGDLISSYFLILFSYYFYKYRFLVLALPAIMNLRGSSYITYSARIVTKLYLGIIEPRLSLRQISLRHELSGTLTCILISNIVVGLLISVVYKYLLHGDTCSISNIVLILVTAAIISASFVIPLTTVVLVLSFARGMRPETLIGALESVLGDVITVPGLAIACMLSEYPYAILIPVLLLASTSLLLLFLSHSFDRELSPTWRIYRIIPETVTAAAVSAVIERITGTVILTNFERIISKSYLMFALLPPVLATCGAVCVNAAVTYSTLLHLGELNVRKAVLHVVPKALSQSVIAYMNIFLIGIVLASFTHSKIPLLTLLAHILLSGLISVMLLLPLAYALVLALARIGINPVNFASPVIMPICDLTTTLMYVLLLQMCV